MSFVFQEAMPESSRNTSSPGASAESSSTAEGFQTSFMSHPTQRQLREFMQVLLKELLLGVSSPKQWLPLEVLLEVGCWTVYSGRGLALKDWRDQITAG